VRRVAGAPLRLLRAGTACGVSAAPRSAPARRARTHCLDLDVHNGRAIAQCPVTASGSERLTLRQIMSLYQQPAARGPCIGRSVGTLRRQRRRGPQEAGATCRRRSAVAAACRCAARAASSAAPASSAAAAPRLRSASSACGQGGRHGVATYLLYRPHAAPGTPPAAAAPQHDAAAPGAAADRPRARAARRARRAFCARARAARSSAALAAAPAAAAARRASSAARATAAAARARSAARAACARPGGHGRRLARRGEGRGGGRVADKHHVQKPAWPCERRECAGVQRTPEAHARSQQACRHDQYCMHSLVQDVVGSGPKAKHDHPVVSGCNEPTCSSAAASARDCSSRSRRARCAAASSAAARASCAASRRAASLAASRAAAAAAACSAMACPGQQLSDDALTFA